MVYFMHLGGWASFVEKGWWALEGLRIRELKFVFCNAVVCGGLTLRIAVRVVLNFVD